MSPHPFHFSKSTHSIVHSCHYATVESIGKRRKIHSLRNTRRRKTCIMVRVCFHKAATICKSQGWAIFEEHGHAAFTRMHVLCIFNESHDDERELDFESVSWWSYVRVPSRVQGWLRCLQNTEYVYMYIYCMYKYAMNRISWYRVLPIYLISAKCIRSLALTRQALDLTLSRPASTALIRSLETRISRNLKRRIHIRAHPSQSSLPSRGH